MTEKEITMEELEETVITALFYWSMRLKCTVICRE